MHSRLSVVACLLCIVGCSEPAAEVAPVPCGPDKTCPEGFVCRAAAGQALCIDESSVRITKTFVVTGQLPPYVMLAIDKSDSMNDPAFPGSPTTKWDDVLAALTEPEHGLLNADRDRARWGLTLFPSGEGCEPGSVGVPLAPDRDNADLTIAELRRVVAAGRRPTALSLVAAAEDPRLSEQDHPLRWRAVLLLTDGLPNCNPSPLNQQRCDACNADASSCEEASGCQPTFGPSKTACDLVAAPKGSDCLDETGTVQAIELLRASGVETFVVGYGDALDETADRVLDAAAEAGGTALSSAGRKYYKAANPVELRSALSGIFPLVYPPACALELDPAPADGELRVALYEIPSEQETVLEKGRQWRFSTQGSFARVELLGEICDRLHGAAPDSLEIRVSYVPAE